MAVKSRNISKHVLFIHMFSLWFDILRRFSFLTVCLHSYDMTLTQRLRTINTLWMFTCWSCACYCDMHLTKVWKLHQWVSGLCYAVWALLRMSLLQTYTTNMYVSLLKGPESVPACQKVILQWDPRGSGSISFISNTKTWRDCGRSLSLTCSLVAVWRVCFLYKHHVVLKGSRGRCEQTDTDWTTANTIMQEVACRFSKFYTFFFLFYIVHYVKETF